MGNGRNGGGGRRPSYEGPAARLEGSQLPGGWVVLKRIDRADDATGGLFSIGYRVKRTDGHVAYMKAHDYAQALRQSPAEVTRILDDMFSAYLLEKELNEHCAEARMSRVVRVLEAGALPVEDNPLPVNYLIFELAEGDVRNRLGNLDRDDLAWKLRTIHQIATGLSQLHRSGVMHQDMKPSNMLVFGPISKVGDLGNAWHRGRMSPLVDARYAGDPHYAPPECQYWFELPSVEERLKARDLYMFGSVILFLFLAIDSTCATQTKLPIPHRAGMTTATFEQALPHLVEATEQVAEELEDALGDDEELRGIADRYRELCHPDPLQRGHPTARKRHGNRYALDRYVSYFDYLARLAEGGAVSMA